MGRTNIMARKKYNLRRYNFQRRRPSQQRPRPRPISVKYDEHCRHRNKEIKIKKLLAQPKKIQVKHRGQVVRGMTVRHKSIFPAKRRQGYLFFSVLSPQPHMSALDPSAPKIF